MLGVLFVSIHVLRVEEDLRLSSLALRALAFQSTSSVWRTTHPAHYREVRHGISIHVLRVEDDAIVKVDAPDYAISIHVLRVEDDRRLCYERMRLWQFQSTSSVWRTTCNRQCAQRYMLISIHVLRVEDDPGSATAGYTAQVFQSTSSVWRTTDLRRWQFPGREISIHVLRVEDDRICLRCGGRLH